MPLAVARAFRALLLCGWALAACSHAQSPPPPADPVALLADWLAGEWNNNEQVWQQRIDAANPKLTQREGEVEHRHHIVVPLASHRLGGRVLFVQPSHGEDLTQTREPYLVRLSSNDGAGTVQQDTLRLRAATTFVNAHLQPDKLAALGPADVLPASGCELLWRFDAVAQSFSGSTRAGLCLDSPGGPVLQLDQAQQLSAQWWTSLEQTRDASGTLLRGNKTDTPQRSRKARYFQGWVWFKLAGPGAAADDKKTSFTAKYLLHAEGQRMVVRHEDGSESPYMLELAVLTYQNTRRPVLKFALLDRHTLKSLSYVWANTEATTIGLNLGWFQAGLTQKAERPAFGF